MMNAKKHQRRWDVLLAYAAGTTVCLFAVLSALTGLEWCGSLALFCVGLLFIVGTGRRIFRVGVRRAGDEIVCRYRPLFEGYAYLWAIVMPTLGGSIVACGFVPGNPGWWRFTGIIIVLLCPLMIFGIVRMGRRALLFVTPSVLKVRGSSYAGEGATIREIRRDLVQTIEPKRVTKWNWLQVEVVYRTEGASGETKNVGLGPLGPQVSVQTSSLLEALTIWKEGDGREPSELMDQVERALRDRSRVGA